MTASLATFGEGYDFSNAGRFLLFLQCGNLLTAIPPLLLRKLKRLGLEFFDRQRLWLLAFLLEAGDEDLLPFISRTGKEFAS